MLERTTEPRVLDDTVEVLLRDADQKMVSLYVSREALEDYCYSRGIKTGTLVDMFLGPAYRAIIEAADRLYEGHAHPRPSRIDITAEVLNG